MLPFDFPDDNDFLWFLNFHTYLSHKIQSIKNASAGNRTRVDSLEGYNSTTKPPMLVHSSDFHIIYYCFFKLVSTLLSIIQVKISWDYKKFSSDIILRTRYHHQDCSSLRIKELEVFKDMGNSIIYMMILDLPDTIVPDTVKLTLLSEYI